MTYFGSPFESLFSRPSKQVRPSSEIDSGNEPTGQKASKTTPKTMLFEGHSPMIPYEKYYFLRFWTRFGDFEVRDPDFGEKIGHFGRKIMKFERKMDILEHEQEKEHPKQRANIGE